MFLGQKTEKTTELSTNVITHKLQIKWENPKYITKKQADEIFSQIADKEKATVTFINTKNSTFFEFYKRDIKISKLDSEKADFEDILFRAWLTEGQKEEVRQIWEERKKEKKKTTVWVLENVIDFVKNWNQEEKKYETKLGDYRRKKTCLVIEKMRENKKKIWKYAI